MGLFKWQVMNGWNCKRNHDRICVTPKKIAAVNLTVGSQVYWLFLSRLFSFSRGYVTNDGKKKSRQWFAIVLFTLPML